MTQVSIIKAAEHELCYLGPPCRSGHVGLKLDLSLSSGRDLVVAVISRVYI